jgi:hypothetical protein
MRHAKRMKPVLLMILALAGVIVALQGCAPGTVYVGVSAPGPWVGYPGGYGRPYPGGYYGRPYPGRYYGRRRYSPDAPVPQGPQESVGLEPVEGIPSSVTGREPENPPAGKLTPEPVEKALCPTF